MFRGSRNIRKAPSRSTRRCCTTPRRVMALICKTAKRQVRRDRRAPRQAWALTPVTPTSRSAAPSCCPTVPARLSASWCSPRATRPRLPRPPAPITWATMDLVEKIQKENWFDFDVVVATPDMMGIVGRLGKVAGPQGPDAQPQGRHRDPRRRQGRSRKPRPVRSSTVWTRPTSSTAPSARCPSAPRSCWRTIAALIGAIIKAKPAAAKGQYIKSCVAASTMGPGVKMNANKQL